MSLIHAVLFTLLGGTPSLVTTVQEDTHAARIAALMEETYPADEPGAAVIAMRGDEVVYSGARGLASVELQVPVTPRTTFCLASVTKPFTALAVMQLVEADELALHEPVTDYVDALENAGEVTIEHALSHTSGIPDMGSLPGYMEQSIHLGVSPDDLIATVAELPLEFEPGERFEYSNANFAVLARIVELISEQPWEDYLREHMFEPVGMTATYYGGHRRILPGSATGYTYRGGAWRRSHFLSYTRGFGLGGLFSCVEDLGAWHRALVSGQIVSQETLDEMWSPFELNDGGRGDCGLSFFVPDSGSTRVIQHGGGIFGWTTYVLWLPDDDVFVAILTNRDRGPDSVQQVAVSIAQMLK